jgi:hypothetical protein
VPKFNPCTRERQTDTDRDRTAETEERDIWNKENGNETGVYLSGRVRRPWVPSPPLGKIKGNGKGSSSAPVVIARKIFRENHTPL